MSLDDAAEQALYNAIAAVAMIPRPKERERMCKEAIDMLGRIAGWQTLFTGSME